MANDVNIVIGAEDQASRVLDAVGKKLEKISNDNIANIAKTAASFFAFSTAKEWFADFATNVIEAANRIDALTDIANGLGESAGDLRQFQFAMEEAGNVSAEGTISALQKMQRIVGSIASGGDQAGAEVFKKLGLDAQQLSLSGPINQFMQVKAAIAGISNDSERAATAQQLLGKSAADLLPAILSSQEAFQESLMFAEKIGFAITEAEAVGVANMNDALGRTSAMFDAIYGQLAVEIAPLITILAEDTQNWLKPLTEAESTTIPSLVEQLARLKGQLEFIVPDNFGQFFERMNPLNTLNTLDEIERAGERAVSAFYAMRTANEAMVESKREQLAIDQKAKQAAEDLAKVEKQKQLDLEKSTELYDRQLASLNKQLLVARFGAEFVQRQEELAAARDIAERDYLESLQQQIIEQQKLNEIKKQFDEEEKKRAADEKRRQDKAIEEQEAKQQAMRGNPQELQATESRVLTRGPVNKAMDEIAASSREAAKRLASIDENLQRTNRPEQTVRFQEVA